MPRTSEQKNARVAVMCLVVFAAMVGAGFAAVPLYRAFCQATGYDGTTGRAEAAPVADAILDKTVDVRFDTNVRELPWTFVAEETSQTIRIGATSLAHFKVTNTGKTATTGQALFNVLPESAGAHFKKLQCFCFKEQTLQPGQTMEFPVVYFVDPAYATDFETKGKSEITLSYTFYPSKGGAIQQALGEPAKAGL